MRQQTIKRLSGTESPLIPRTSIPTPKLQVLPLTEQSWNEWSENEDSLDASVNEGKIAVFHYLECILALCKHRMAAKGVVISQDIREMVFCC